MLHRAGAIESIDGKTRATHHRDVEEMIGSEGNPTSLTSQPGGEGDGIDKAPGGIGLHDVERKVIGGVDMTGCETEGGRGAGKAGAKTGQDEGDKSCGMTRCINHK